MTETKIIGIIWDFGNILASFDHLKACKRLAKYSAFSPEDIFKKLFGGENAPEKLHETGQLSPQEFFLLVKKLAVLSDDLSFQMFSGIWGDILQENSGVSALLDRIQPGVKQCILSNTDPIHWSAIEQLPVMKKHFSNSAMLIRSYASGTRKPDVKIYQDALACLGFNDKDIEHVLYVDDIAEYREVFERLGGYTLSYDCSKDDLAQLETGLAKFGVLSA